MNLKGRKILSNLIIYLKYLYNNLVITADQLIKLYFILKEIFYFINNTNIFKK